MPRPKSLDECWDYVQREFLPEKQHPRVTCNFCSDQWTSKGKGRVLAHLSACKGLPLDLWEKYQSGREVGGPLPTRKSEAKVREKYVNGASRERLEEDDGDQEDYLPDLDADGDVDDDMTAAQQEAAIQACAQWIYACGLPLSTIEHPAFRTLLQLLNPAWRIPTRVELTHGMLEEEYRGGRDVVHEYLGRTGRVGLGADYQAPAYL
ncbi:hypothetical protein LTR78_005318 [Recurvomyces mirabilis]|uniref:BED-type domain-containing protein n=1 Tax=Recurvomyces mirabilis TaxID=574656 RepID=A0AAE0WNQ7_9PEZI|nr:hypothetical protein LTR78_005318 [Recurvomyces mirabilis]KAK5157868.1 hypothetical protein LTS14_003790 [Recurvomyces mirabilis]